VENTPSLLCKGETEAQTGQDVNLDLIPAGPSWMVDLISFMFVCFFF
jgi:hypothetical protein